MTSQSIQYIEARAIVVDGLIKEEYICRIVQEKGMVG
jgi:hypothetical protein